MASPDGHAEDNQAFPCPICRQLPRSAICRAPCLSGNGRSA